MAKKVSGAKKVAATATASPRRVRTAIAVRLDLPPDDHERASKIARDQGLSLASLARMGLYRLMKELEAGSK